MSALCEVTEPVSERFCHLNENNALVKKETEAETPYPTVDTVRIEDEIMQNNEAEPITPVDMLLNNSPR